MTSEKPAPSSYVVALSEERAMYARSAHDRARTAMVDEDLAAHGWAVDKFGVLVDVDSVPKVAPVDPSVPRQHRERAVTKPPGVEKAVDVT